MSFHSCKDSSIINFWLAQRSYIDYLRFFRFQFVLLLDAFDATWSGVASVLQRSPSLLHPNDFIPIKSAKFERSIQVTDGDGNKLLIANVRKWARWERSLKRCFRNWLLQHDQLPEDDFNYLIPMVCRHVLKYKEKYIVSLWGRWDNTKLVNEYGEEMQQVGETLTADDLRSRLISGCGILKFGNSNVASLRKST